MKNFNWFHFVLFAVTGLLLFCCLRVSVSAAEGDAETYTYTVYLKNSKVENHTITEVWPCVDNPIIFTLPYRVAILIDSKYHGSFMAIRNDSLFSPTMSQFFSKSYKRPDGSIYTMSSKTQPNTTYNDINGNYLYSGNYDGIPVFTNYDAMVSYLQTGDDSGDINKDNYEKLTDDKPLFDDFAELDFSDTDTNYLQDFRLEGFRSDYFVNAVWSSVHIPNKLQQWMDKGTIDMDDVAVMVMFTYANKNFPETDKYTKYYPRLLSATDLAATINVADFAPANDMYYLSGLSFIPVVEFTYYNSGMGTSMKPLNLMYYGSMNHIYFKQDGSANGAAFDAGDINGNKDGGFGLGNDDYNGIGGITGDITDALSKFSELLDSLYGSLSRVAKFATVVFSWLPWWASLLIGAAVAVCFILRIAGR